MSRKPHIASDEDMVRDREEKARIAREQELNDVKTLLAMPVGKRFFKRLLAMGHIFTTTFTGNSAMYFQEGERNFALKLVRDVMETKPELLSELYSVDQEEKTNG